jgi:hypothetical protein
MIGAEPESDGRRVERMMPESGKPEALTGQLTELLSAGRGAEAAELLLVSGVISTHATGSAALATMLDAYRTIVTKAPALAS